MPLEVFTSETSNKNEVGSINKEIPDQSEGNDHEELMQRLLDASEIEPERHSLLFRHYKNKFYRFLSLAKHSETLEEFVVYESCYQDDESKYWIRPRNMFFEKKLNKNDGYCDFLAKKHVSNSVIIKFF